MRGFQPKAEIDHSQELKCFAVSLTKMRKMSQSVEVWTLADKKHVGWDDFGTRTGGKDSVKSTQCLIIHAKRHEEEVVRLSHRQGKPVIGDWVDAFRQTAISQKKGAAIQVGPDLGRSRLCPAVYTVIRAERLWWRYTKPLPSKETTLGSIRSLKTTTEVERCRFGRRKNKEEGQWRSRWGT